jgi:hypothetical protein
LTFDHDVTGSVGELSRSEFSQRGFELSPCRDLPVLDVSPQRDGQAPGQRDDAHSPHAPAGAGKAPVEPERQVAVWLEANPFVSDLKWSLRCAAVAALPLAAGIWLLTALLGGLHGGRKLVWLAALWPMIVLDPLTKDSDGPLVWVVFLIAEFGYAYLLVFASRSIWRISSAKHRS